MLRAEMSDVRQIIDKSAGEFDPCKRIDLYDDDVQEMMQYIYEALWRFNLRNSQIIYVLNEAIRPFRIKK